MVPTQAYLELKDTPPVLLCEAMQASVRFLTMALMGRMPGAAKRYRVTEPVLDGLRRLAGDPRHRGGSAAEHQALLDAADAILEGAAPLAKERSPPDPYAEFNIRGGLVDSLRRATLAPGAVDCAPGNPGFAAVRARLFAAQGLPDAGVRPVA